MSESQIKELELNIKDAKEMVAMANSISRLKNNRDFKRVILDGYMKDEAVRLVHLKSDNAMQKQELQVMIENCIVGIGCFTNYLRFMEQQGESAKEAIEEMEDAITSIEEDAE